MREWSVQDAEGHVGELLDTCEREGPQILTREGSPAAVVVPVAEWERLRGVKPQDPPRYATLKEWLMTDFARGDLNIPPRGHYKHRPPPTFDD